MSKGSSIAVIPRPLDSLDMGSIVNYLKSAIPYKVILCSPGSNKVIAHPIFVPNLYGKTACLEC